MINSEMKGSKDGVFNLKDVKPQTFKFFLQFIGKCEFCQNGNESESEDDYFSIYQMIKDENQELMDKELIKIMIDIYAFGDEYYIDSILDDISLKLFLSQPDLYIFTIYETRHRHIDRAPNR